MSQACCGARMRLRMSVMFAGSWFARQHRRGPSSVVPIGTSVNRHRAEKVRPRGRGEALLRGAAEACSRTAKRTCQDTGAAPKKKAPAGAGAGGLQVGSGQTGDLSCPMTLQHYHVIRARV